MWLYFASRKIVVIIRHVVCPVCLLSGGPDSADGEADVDAEPSSQWEAEHQPTLQGMHTL